MLLRELRRGRRRVHCAVCSSIPGPWLRLPTRRALLDIVVCHGGVAGFGVDLSVGRVGGDCYDVPGMEEAGEETETCEASV